MASRTSGTRAPRPQGPLRFRLLVTLGGSLLCLFAAITLAASGTMGGWLIWLAAILVVLAIADGQAAARRMRRGRR